MKHFSESVDLDELHGVADIFRILPPDPSFLPLPCMYRGQPDFEWNLVPGLFRLKPFEEASENTWEGIETSLLQAFVREGAPYLNGFIDTPFRRRMLAQHYGVPTRLLDWTLNPLVALYFAVCKLNGPAVDGAFYIGQASRGLTEGVDGTIEAAVNNHDFTQLLPTEFDSRIIAQRALFSTHRLPASREPFVPPAVGQTTDPRIIKYRIRHGLKPKVKLELEQIGVDQARLFPGLDGIGRNLRWKFDRQPHWRLVISEWKPT